MCDNRVPLQYAVEPLALLCASGVRRCKLDPGLKAPLTRFSNFDCLKDTQRFQLEPPFVFLNLCHYPGAPPNKSDLLVGVPAARSALLERLRPQ